MAIFFFWASGFDDFTFSWALLFFIFASSFDELDLSHGVFFYCCFVLFLFLLHVSIILISRMCHFFGVGPHCLTNCSV